MRLIIESGDVAKTGLAVGEYDLDYGRVSIDLPYPPPGSYPIVNINLRMDQGMKPTPGSSGAPHFKVEATVARSDTGWRGKTLTVSAQPNVVEKRHFSDAEVGAWTDPEETAKFEVRATMRDAMTPATDAMAKDLVAQLLGVKSPDLAKKAAEMELKRMNPSRAVCDECAGTGEWINPANGVGSPCSKCTGS